MGFFWDLYYSCQQLIGQVVEGLGSCLNARIINVEGHTHTNIPSLSREVTGFNKRWSVAVCF